VTSADFGQYGFSDWTTYSGDLSKFSPELYRVLGNTPLLTRHAVAQDARWLRWCGLHSTGAPRVDRRRDSRQMSQGNGNHSM
jgi:hypothetical protein